MESPRPSLSSSSSFWSTSSSKLEYIYEIEYVLEESRIPSTEFPVINPFSVYTKPSKDLKKTFQKLIDKSTPSPVKEYIKASKFNQNHVPTD